jgi:uncharacterized protein (TIGR03000 family)
MALSGGAEVPDLGHHSSCGGGGCCGGYVVMDCGGGGCCGGGYACSGSSSCHGGGHRLFGGHRRGHSSCHGGGHGCCGGGYSCCGGGYACSGGYVVCGGGACSGGYVCGGGYGCTGGGWGCTGGMPCGGMYAPQMAPPGKEGGEKLKEMPKEKKDKEEVSAPATIVLSLPADAKVSIDGVATTSTSASRTFVTPELAPAKAFVYTFSAKIVRDGQTLTATEQVSVRAGAESRVNLGAEKFTAVTVAAK